jgi:hypothetical protein
MPLVRSDRSPYLGWSRELSWRIARAHNANTAVAILDFPGATYE